MDELEKNQLILHSVALTLAIQILCSVSDESEDFVRKELATLSRLIVDQLSSTDIDRIITMSRHQYGTTGHVELLFIEHDKLKEFLNARNRKN